MLSFLRPGSGSVSRMSAKDAIDRAARGDLLVIDVRDGGEIASSGKAAGALHVPLAALKMRCDPTSPECLAELSVEKPVALYCASGARSQMAAQMLVSMGYAEVYNIGGLYDWHAAGGALER
jgi:rhodanese-related sulfurtransferase